MKPVFENVEPNGMPSNSRKFADVCCHAAPACAPMYQPAQLAAGSTYRGALIGISAACAPGAAAAAAAKPADVAIRTPFFFRIGTLHMFSGCPRTSIGGCTRRTKIPPRPFRAHVAQKTHILTITDQLHSSCY